MLGLPGVIAIDFRKLRAEEGHLRDLLDNLREVMDIHGFSLPRKSFSRGLVRSEISQVEYKKENCVSLRQYIFSLVT